MHRIDRTNLHHIIYGVLVCSRLKRRTGGRQVHASLETQEGKSAVAELICQAIDSDSTMVIQAEMIGFGSSSRPGEWGVDEPVPATVPEPPKPPSNGTE